MTTRQEHDTFGPIDVDADALWGAQTERSRQNFVIGDERFPRVMIKALALVKKAAARSNATLKTLDSAIAQAIDAVSDEVIAGVHDAHFPLVVFQTGSGTQTNMNMNEVLANLASLRLGAKLDDAKKPVHPNDHVNRSQSSNDVFPTAMHVAAVLAIESELLPAIDLLVKTLEGKQRAYAHVVKIGRTHLQDATPITLGQEISGWIAGITHARHAIRQSLAGLSELALGGTAVGTGLNAPAGFADGAIKELAGLTGHAFVPAPNKFQALAGHEAIVVAHGALKALAAAGMKLANDVRWLASGPRAGLGELSIPENEPGSSIMPGKVNPTQSEALVMVALDVMGNDVTIGMAAASGNFELNVTKPVILSRFLRSVRLLGDALRSFEEHCARGIAPIPARMKELLERSLMLVTALAPVIGYEKAAEIAKTAHKEGTSLREAALKLGYVDAETFDRVVRPEQMLGDQ